mmetsp:Transcript_47000/g.151742  ORF Transcript_47000/g.151742 Transcript_47000/m.151742 type:complete len:542 (-) Transcript_47000:200-1825(-)
MRRVLLLVLLADAAAFKFLTDFGPAKLIPRPSAMLKRRRATKKFGDKKLAVITGASSGAGLEAAANLLRTGEYHVFGAVRDLDKMRDAALDRDFPADDFTPLQVELGSFASVRAFCKDLERSKLNRPIDRLICNAAVYQPGEAPAWSADGHEMTLQVNYLSHFLMASLLLPGMAKSADPRVILAGGASAEESVEVYPRADLGALQGLKLGAKNPISMVDGYNFDGAKAYKDSKLCLAMLSHTLHQNYHKQTGIAFSTVYPGAIADSAMLAGKPPLDTSAKLPSFVKAMVEFELNAMRRIGFGQDMHADGLTGEAEAVSTAQAGGRLLQAAHDVRCSKSGHWAWKEGDAAAEAAAAAVAITGGDAGADRARAQWASIYEVEPSFDLEMSQELWRHSSRVTGASWAPANQPKSPCPTLVVVGAITKANNAKEDAKRTLEGLEEDGKGGFKVRAAVIGGTGTVVDAVVGNTLGRVGKLAQEAVLGAVPVEAIEGSFQETKERGAAEAGAAAGAATLDELGQKIEDTLLAGELQARAELASKRGP